MHHSIPMIVSFLLLCSSVTAKELHIDIKAGVNFNANVERYSKDEGLSSPPVISPGVGAVFGVAKQLILTEHLSLQPELLLFQKPYTFYHYSDPGVILHRNPTFLEIPLLMKLHSPMFKRFSLNLYTGSSIGFTLFKIDRYEPYNELEVEAGGGIEFSIANGYGLEYALKKGTLLLDFRYTFGIIADYRKSNVITIMTGYGF